MSPAATADIASPGIALVGCPNCGKTALFNALTGSRQKVANYAGVTVERKEGSFTTPAGRRVRVLDLPGTYSLRARSPDEAITRDVVLGLRADEAGHPDALVCVADATNLRVVLRLVLELKRTGRPLLLALNMIDIARRQGCEIDLERLSDELGIPVVPTVAVRKGGIAPLLAAIDGFDFAGPAPEPAAGGWHEPSTAKIRDAHREVERILKLCSFRAGDAGFTAKLDRVLLHPVFGIAILLGVLFMGGAGLHGRAFIPLLSSFACAIPGVMATRVIEQRRDRLATILVAPLMTCSARIPVYTLIISAFVADRTVWGFVGLQGLVMFGLYATGILSALAVAFVTKRLIWRSTVPEPFLMELPAYKWPRPRNVGLGLWTRVTIFLRRAGTIILGLMILIWFLSSFPAAPPDAVEPAINYSIAGMVGHALEPLVAPIGFNWQIAVALIPGLAAREVAVGALGTVYAVAASSETMSGALAPVLAAQWSLPTAFALLAWYIFAPQCAATLAVVKRETNSWRWPAILFAYMIALAYAAAFVTYQVSAALLSSG